MRHLLRPADIADGSRADTRASRPREAARAVTPPPDTAANAAQPDDERAMPMGTGAVADFITYLRERLRMHQDIAANEKAGRLVADVLGAIDRASPEDFLAALEEDCEFRFASTPAVHGHAAIDAMVRGLLSTTESIEHHCENVWSTDGHVIARGVVEYRFKDGSIKKVPFCDVWRLGPQGKIARYEIYCDMNV